MAQLERLRIQERWKKMTDPLLPGPPLLNAAAPPPRPLFPKFGTALPTPTPTPSEFGSSLMLHQKVINGGFAAGYWGGGGGGRSDQFPIDPYYKIGSLDDSGFQKGGGGGFETSSRELSSMPKMQCYVDDCGVSLKVMIYVYR